MTLTTYSNFQLSRWPCGEEKPSDLLICPEIQVWFREGFFFTLLFTLEILEVFFRCVTLYHWTGLIPLGCDLVHV